MSLYRPEVIEAQRKRLYGSVTIHQSPSLMAMTGVAVVVTVLASVFLATGSYARKESVTGWVVPEAGMAEVYAAKGGVANQVMVKVGDAVAAGQTLAVLSADMSGPGGALAPQQRAMTRARMVELDAQMGASGVRQDREQVRLVEHATALRAEAEHLKIELRLEQQQLAIAKRQLEAIQPLVNKGFVAVIEKDRREQAVFSGEQSLTEMERQIDAKLAEAADSDIQARAVPTAKAVELSQLRASRSTLEQNLAELAVQDTLVLRAPVAGKVAAVNIRSGDTASATAPLFAIAPTSGKLEAELLAPTRAAGFIASGQKVRLMVDAFPSERFGQIEGVIDTVSRAPITAAQVAIPLDIKEPVYRLSVRLAADHVQAYGKPQPLQPGMTLKASVVTAKRTFFQWMFDPLLAAGRNLG